MEKLVETAWHNFREESIGLGVAVDIFYVSVNILGILKINWQNYLIWGGVLPFKANILIVLTIF